ncbi:EAL domain-containing protein (putative c-di-GMP-specific phosphodiesterase class I) [Maritimibacter alkaliphilus HTCC2654]|uniref:EAL domain protein n=1 Tax=Maritimibacter alkaliphilus HTCC2654 TaxID=314271 RepID=A3VB52_9RHOB|nr:EAL domain-containing protein [Maritimibacter alkaliphilus]EAQ14192.1 EAL domain protein [Rhodobacterales bacterium HTCC2654] [Maritimibacter alkaliphilus HTCC2654]TYP82667.1 EAL domain-containing protein (putative c-di-GMP-specific phosphodiesterase class I) [Maritimibacter alkaliphilus HTCC2654]
MRFEIPDEPDVVLSSPLTIAIQQRDRDTMAMVRRAVQTKQVMLAFQPVMRAQAADTVAFYEGLIRVLDHTGRIIPAKDFIDVVEEQELGRIIDALALELGLAALEEEPSLTLSINMSARSIGYPRWKTVLRQGLERDPTLGERLILEITERTAIVMPDLVQVFMSEMQAEGISFALDDFGAGYTAFRYLRDLYFDILKIDGEFIRGIADNPDNQVIAQAMLSLARHFDMMTVAECVETLEDAQFMADNGCDFLQGYFFGAPTIRPWWKGEGLEQRQRA